MLVIPTAWAHYSAWALLPLAVLAIVLASGSPSRPLIALFALAATLIVLGSERDVWRGATHDGPIRLVLTFKAYGLFLLWLAAALAAWRMRPVPYGGPERRRTSLLFGRIEGF
jgi:hypothetical protein